MNRIGKVEYYLNIAREASRRGTCLRRNYGAVIVQNDRIVSTGYTGAPEGRFNCCDLGKCKRVEMNIPSGQRYELCQSVHAEQNAIISAGREKTLGSTLFLYGFEVETGKSVKFAEPCLFCERFILNAGIKEVKSFVDFESIEEYTEYISQNPNTDKSRIDILSSNDCEKPLFVKTVFVDKAYTDPIKIQSLKTTNLF